MYPYEVNRPVKREFGRGLTDERSDKWLENRYFVKDIEENAKLSVILFYGCRVVRKRPKGHDFPSRRCARARAHWDFGGQYNNNIIYNISAIIERCCRNGEDGGRDRVGRVFLFGPMSTAWCRSRDNNLTACHRDWPPLKIIILITQT